MRKLLVILAFLAIITPVNAVVNNWEIDISLNEDMSADWTVLIENNETVPQSDYYVLSDITNLRVTVDGVQTPCSVENLDLGTSITCDQEGQNYTYKFKMIEMASKFSNFNRFDYRFGISTVTEKFNLQIDLPIGDALVDDDRLEGTGLSSVEPDLGQNCDFSCTVKGTDGRSIFVRYSIINPDLGQTIDAKLIYEGFDDNLQLIAFVVIALIATSFIVIIILIRKRDYKAVLPILTETERKVMEILLRERKQIDQRDITKELDYSKPKMSRVIKDLSDRGLIEVTRKGRKNLIKLIENPKIKQKSEDENKKEDK